MEANRWREGRAGAVRGSRVFDPGMNPNCILLTDVTPPLEADAPARSGGPPCVLRSSGLPETPALVRPLERTGKAARGLGHKWDTKPDCH